MLSFLENFFRKPKPLLQMTDADFGRIQYVEPSTDFPYGFWQMVDGWPVSYQPQPVSCSSIPGDDLGPNPDARSFLLKKRDDAELLWRICEPEIGKLLSEWPGLEHLSPRDAFFISSIAMDSDKHDGWEVCFQTKEGLKWIYFCLQIEGERVASNTIDT